MARRDWDRLRRERPLDGADARLDPDGAVLWEREMGPERHAGSAPSSDARSGFRRLRAGIVVRRVQERRDEGAVEPKEPPAPPPQPRAASVFDPSAWVECPRCKARVPRRKLLLHARASCVRRGG